MLAIALLLSSLAITACRSNDNPQPKPPTIVTVSYRADDASRWVSEALNCRRQSPACQIITDLPNEIWQQPAAGRACSAIYGGAQQALVSGVLRGGQVIDTQFSRSDGCQISRWEQLEPLLRSLGLLGAGRR